jgi:hypothetical protein
MKRLTPLLCGGATSRAFGLKIMLPSPHPQQHGVSPDSLPFTTIFISEFQHNFFVSSRLCFFALSRFGFHPTFMFHRDAFGF